LFDTDDEARSADIEELVADDEDERISLPLDAEVVIRSEEIARGLSPRTRSINQRCEVEINFVELSDASEESAKPSEESCFCRRAKIIRDTTPAKSPVDQSIRIAIRNGNIKNNDLPSMLSRNSRDFRGAISIKEPKTTRPATDKIVSGQ
jgi:hypothetical protein